MKRLKQTLAIVLTLTMILIVTGCSTPDLKWSYKDDLTTMSIGSYIYYNNGAFYTASNKVEDSNGDFFDQEVEDDDGNKMTAREFIAKETEKSCRAFLAVNQIMKELDIALDATEIQGANTNADNTWLYMKTTYEGYGISRDSFLNASTMLNAKYDKIFSTMYGTGGEKEVSAQEISKYFTENYTNYSYFSVPLYDEASLTDEEMAASDASASTATAKSKDEIDEIKRQLDAYALSVNNSSKTFEEVTEKYMETSSLTEDPSTASVAVLEDSGLPEDLIKAYSEMKEGQAKVIQVGESDTTAVCYLLYKGKIADKVEEYTNEDNKLDVIADMKSEEFLEYVDKRAAELKCDINEQAINKYPAEKYITYVEPTDAAQ